MEQPQNPNNKKPNFKLNLYWIYTIIAFILIGGYYYSNLKSTTDVSWSKFQQYAKDGSIKNIVVFQGQNMLEATVQDSAIKKVTGKTKQELGTNPKITVQIPSSDKISDLVAQWERENGVSVPLQYEKGNEFFSQFLWTFGPLILLAFVWIYFMRRMSGQGGAGGGVFNVGKAKAQIFDKSAQNKVTFKDVAGLSEAKQEVEEIVEFLRNPSKFTELGGKIPKGALLIGPPGTGKTLLAKAVAGEADVPFFSLSGSDFVEMFVGVGASRVRDLFRQAKEKAPCIIFIDEIDAVGRARGKNPSMGGNDERESTLNQLLTEMDGFGTNSGIIVMAATNRVDILDKALLRAGRFDRQINVDLPDLNDRKEIFGVHLRPIKIDESVNIEFMARQTPGFSGADIANVCNEAALIAARNGKTYVQKQDFMDAVDRIIGGLEKKTKITTREEREAISIHESGHATLSWFLEHASPLIKVTIVPRGRALGAAWYLPEERQITTKEQMLDEMCATLGGRAAEEIFLGRISTGAINDLERVNKQAYAMIAYYGMSENLSNICYYDSTGQEYGFTKPYSEATALLIDQEVNKMINVQYARAKQMLLEHKDGHRALTDKLLETEVIYKEDLEKIFGERAWKSRSEEVLANVEPQASEPQQENADDSEPNTDSQTL